MGVLHRPGRISGLAYSNVGVPWSPRSALSLQDVYESAMGKKLPPAQETSHVHMGTTLRGIVLPFTVQPVPGVIKLSTISEHNVSVTDKLPVAGKGIDSVKKDIVKQLAVKPKMQTGADGEGGDADGSFVVARASAGSKRKGDSDDSDFDPMDALFSGPFLTSKKVGKASSTTDEDEDPLRRKSVKRVFGAVPRSEPPTPAFKRTLRDEPSTGDRKKQIAAEQAAKSAIVDGEGVLRKLADDQLVNSVTIAQLTAVIVVLGLGLA